MKALRTYLTINVFVALLSGLAFLLFSKQFTAGQGTVLSSAGLIFVKTIGGMILSVAILDWYARDLKDRKMMQGVLLTNFFVHAISIVIDVTGIVQGVINGSSEWFNIVFRGVFALGFLYFILKNPLPNQK